MTRKHLGQLPKRAREFENGDDLRDALPLMDIGTLVRYHGALHTVIDAGEQGHRIAAVQLGESEGEPYDTRDGNR